MTALTPITIVYRMDDENIYHTEIVRVWGAFFGPVIARIDALYEEHYPKLQWHDIEAYADGVRCALCYCDAERCYIDTAARVYYRPRLELENDKEKS